MFDELTGSEVWEFERRWMLLFNPGVLPLLVVLALRGASSLVELKREFPAIAPSALKRAVDQLVEFSWAARVDSTRIAVDVAHASLMVGLLTRLLDGRKIPAAPAISFQLLLDQVQVLAWASRGVQVQARESTDSFDGLLSQVSALLRLLVLGEKAGVTVAWPGAVDPTPEELAAAGARLAAEAVL